MNSGPSLSASPEPPLTFQEIPLDRLHPFRLNPRQGFSEEGLEDLAASIREHGVQQPVLVRPRNVSRHGRAEYDLIAGERRWRAAAMAGLGTIPAVVRPATDHRYAVALSLIENIQREDLNAVEEAQAYDRLMEMGYKQSQIGALVGFAQPRISNVRRILTLPLAVQQRIIDGRLSAGTAIALLTWVKALDIGDAPDTVGRLAEALIEHKVPKKVLERELPEEVRLAAGLPHPAGQYRAPKPVVPRNGPQELWRLRRAVRELWELLDPKPAAEALSDETRDTIRRALEVV